MLLSEKHEGRIHPASAADGPAEGECDVVVLDHLALVVNPGNAQLDRSVVFRAYEPICRRTLARYVCIYDYSVAVLHADIIRLHGSVAQGPICKTKINLKCMTIENYFAQYT